MKLFYWQKVFQRLQYKYLLNIVQGILSHYLISYAVRHHRSTNYEYEDVQLEGETEKKFKTTARLDGMVGVV